MLPRAGVVSAEFCRRRLGGDRQRRPFVYLPGSDVENSSHGGRGSGMGSAGVRSLRLPNLHTAEREYRARLYRLVLRRSGIAQLGVYTTGKLRPAGACAASSRRNCASLHLFMNMLKQCKCTWSSACSYPIAPS